jgi:pimeloyl-ACP methyl ester carboxylesterase
VVVGLAPCDPGHRRPAARADQGLTFVTVQGGPHNVAWTHPEVVNPALLDFLAK